MPIIDFYVGNYGNQNFVVRQFPLAYIAEAMDETPLARALKASTPHDLSFPYTFDGYDGYEDYGEKTKKMNGILYVGNASINLTLVYGGKKHLVTMLFSSPNTYIFNSTGGNYAIRYFEFELKQLLVDGVIDQNSVVKRIMPGLILNEI